MIKKIIIQLIIFVLLLMQVNAIDYSKTTGDSLFVVGVDWQKVQGTVSEYEAYVTVDLNYGQYVNPLNRYAIVEQYHWNNWWSDSAQFGTVGTLIAGIDTSDDFYTFQQLDFYYELPDIKSGSEADDYQCNVQGICGDIVPTTRIGYYGLPFYIQTLEFVCDDNDKNKGGITLTPDISDIDTITLTRPNYEGIPNAEVTIETAVTPLGFGTRPSEVVRYNGIPVTCKNMDTTTNSRLSFILKPNALYRDLDPNIEGSETWEYDDIISLLPSVVNSETLPFNLNIDFNFSANFWDYEIDTNATLKAFENAYYSGDSQDLICTLDFRWFTLQEKASAPNSKSVKRVNFRELTDEQLRLINTGEGVDCMYPKSKTVETINNRQINDILETISIQQQREIVLQLDLLEKKLTTKKFITRTIIPFFVMIILIIFYGVQLVLLGITFLVLIPLMFNQMKQGLKDVFDIDILIEKEKRERGMVKK